jgi:hypothetical protein
MEAHEDSGHASSIELLVFVDITSVYRNATDTRREISNVKRYKR